MVLPIIIPADRATMPARNPWTFRYVYACAGGTPLGAHTPCTRRKHLHGVIDCMVEVWISPVTFLLTLINRSNYSISIALRTEFMRCTLQAYQTLTYPWHRAG